MELFDAHIHLDFMSNAREVAQDAVARGLTLFANTVTPEGYRRTSELVGDLPNVRVGLGLHPWWVEAADIGDFEHFLPTTAWVGEVGLDFSPKRDCHELQAQVFERVARACADEGGKTLSIHSVRSAETVIDILERTGCLASCRCVFHWFSGSTESLWRAIRAGAWFSVNEMQASTRRANEQLKLIPAERLLYETDLPPGQGVTFSAEEIVASLTRARELTEAIRHPHNSPASRKA